jgi:hypothetical protein
LTVKATSLPIQKSTVRTASLPIHKSAAAAGLFFTFIHFIIFLLGVYITNVSVDPVQYRLPKLVLPQLVLSLIKL